MSNTTTTTTITITIPPSQPPPPLLPSLHHHHQPQVLLPTREYRKGNWTIQETLTLITAKKLNEEYRTSRPITPSSASGKLRWNWIEDYCWAHGCYRSQNQCNDKWDNLLRDYKKVLRYHQSRSSSSSTTSTLTSSNASDSYWKMERHQRKLHNLPLNMSREVYEALNEVVQRKHNNINININNPSQLQQQPQQQQPSPAPVNTGQQQPSPVAAAAPTTEVSEGQDTGETEEEAASDRRDESNLKKRRVISSSIKISASRLAQTLKSCDEMKEKRHQQVMELEQRRLQIEETRNDVNRQAISDFLQAITNLSNAIHSIISNYNQQI